MGWRRWSWKTSTLVVLLLLLIVVNPELRAILLFVNSVGVDLSVLLILLQLRLLAPTVGILAVQAGTFLWRALHPVLRGATHTLAQLTLPGRVTGVPTFLVVLSLNLWCLLRKSAVTG
jgi:hypothetical protein